MSNTVNFKLDDDLYFRLLALRVKLHAKGGWKGFVERILSDYGSGTISDAPKSTKIAKEIGKLGSETGSKEELKKRADLFSMPDDEAAREREMMVEKCAVCGHERGEHNLSGPGCYGGGDNCDCQGFVPVKSSVS